LLFLFHAEKLAANIGLISTRYYTSIQEQGNSYRHLDIFTCIKFIDNYYLNSVNMTLQRLSFLKPYCVEILAGCNVTYLNINANFHAVLDDLADLS